MGQREVLTVQVFSVLSCFNHRWGCEAEKILRAHFRRNRHLSCLVQVKGLKLPVMTSSRKFICNVLSRRTRKHVINVSSTCITSLARRMHLRMESLHS